MSFNPEYTKPVQKVVFSRKINETQLTLLMINNVPVKRILFHKHLGLILLDSKLDFNPLSADPTKWSNTLLTILWDWRLKG